MLLSRDSVELLAPAGTWEALEAAVAAGADAVYLGGKRFNMRLHRRAANFNDEQLSSACEYAHAKGVKLYITVNNLLCERELPAMRSYLTFLNSYPPRCAYHPGPGSSPIYEGDGNHPSSTCFGDDEYS